MYRNLIDACRGSSRQPSPFCFGKRGQNHVGRGVALRVPCAVRPLRRRANSLRSDSARLFSEVSCTARPSHQAREQASEFKKIKWFKLGLARIYRLVQQERQRPSLGIQLRYDSHKFSSVLNSKGWIAWQLIFLDRPEKQAFQNIN